MMTNCTWRAITQRMWSSKTHRKEKGAVGLGRSIVRVNFFCNMLQFKFHRDINFIHFHQDKNKSGVSLFKINLLQCKQKRAGEKRTSAKILQAKPYTHIIGGGEKKNAVWYRSAHGLILSVCIATYTEIIKERRLLISVPTTMVDRSKIALRMRTRSHTWLHKDADDQTYYHPTYVVASFDINCINKTLITLTAPEHFQLLTLPKSSLNHQV